MGRQKSLKCPPIPKTWYDLKLPSIYLKSVSGEEWNIIDMELPNTSIGEKILGFCSTSGQDMLRRSVEWYIDGTFDVVSSTWFSQLWVIVVRTPFGVVLPAAFFLLPNKETMTYKLCLQQLQDFCKIEGPTWVHLDFEASALKAVRLVKRFV